MDHFFNSLDSHGVSKETPGPVKVSSLQNSLQGALKVLTTILSIPCFSQLGGKEILSRYTTFFWLIEPEILNRFLLSRHKYSTKKQPLCLENLDNRDKRVGSSGQKENSKGLAKRLAYSFIHSPSFPILSPDSLSAHAHGSTRLIHCTTFPLFLSSHYSLSSGPESRFLNESI